MADGLVDHPANRREPGARSCAAQSMGEHAQLVERGGLAGAVAEGLAHGRSRGAEARKTTRNGPGSRGLPGARAPSGVRRSDHAASQPSGSPSPISTSSHGRFSAAGSALRISARCGPAATRAPISFHPGANHVLRSARPMPRRAFGSARGRRRCPRASGAKTAWKSRARELISSAERSPTVNGEPTVAASSDHSARQPGAPSRAVIDSVSEATGRAPRDDWVSTMPVPGHCRRESAPSRNDLTPHVRELVGTRWRSRPLMRGVVICRDLEHAAPWLVREPIR